MYSNSREVNFMSNINQHNPGVFDSRLDERNTNLENDRLYQPLRNAVSKPSHQYEPTHIIAEQHALHSSHVAHKYRHLSNE